MIWDIEYFKVFQSILKRIEIMCKNIYLFQLPKLIVFKVYYYVVC